MLYRFPHSSPPSFTLLDLSCWIAKLIEAASKIIEESIEESIVLIYYQCIQLVNSMLCFRQRLGVNR
jgi:hypothetical protein